MDKTSSRPDLSDACGQAAGQRRRASPCYLAPWQVLVIMAVAIFVAEFGDMLLLSVLPPLPVWEEALVDASALLLILSPFYFILYRPFKTHWEERLRSEQEVRHLSRQLINAAEAERKRIAQDLHDEFGQLLTAQQLGLETLKNFLPEENREARQQIKRLIGLTAQLGDHTRDVSATLRPVMLETTGLVQTLRWHVKHFILQFPAVVTHFEVDGREERLAPEVELALFRICQESLNNIARHARAGRVRIVLGFSPARVTLTVADDGAGFDPQQGRQKGIGLLGMRERAAALGGGMSLRSGAGKGTTVCVEVPIKKEEENA